MYRTDGAGSVRSLFSGYTVKVWRGKHFFFQQTVPTSSWSVSIKPDQWPQKLAHLRGLLAERDTKMSLVRAANKTIGGLRDSGLINLLMYQPPTWDDPREMNEENTHDLAGALLCALGISRLFDINAGVSKGSADQPIDEEIDRLQVAKGSIKGIVEWMWHRRHPSEPGYLFRWPQGGLDSRGPGDWQAEPSLDEYSGLLMGLRWILSLANNRGDVSISYNDWLSTWPNAGGYVNELLRGIANYLISTDGWLMRPLGSIKPLDDCINDLTVRGPNLLWNAYPVRVMLDGFEGGARLPFRVDKPFKWNGADKAHKFIENSEDRLEEYKEGGEEVRALYNGYNETLDPLKKWRRASHLGRWANLFVPLAYLILPLENETTDIDVWDLYADQVLKKNKQEGDLNTQIFDRYSLAAFWFGANGVMTSTDTREQTGIQDAFYKRSERDILADADTSRSLGMASRVWFGSDFDTIDIWNKLRIELTLFEAGSSTNKPYRLTDGFVLAWALICQALDIDPELSWNTGIRDSEYKELERIAPLFPRLECKLEKVEIEYNKDSSDKIAEPNLWLIPFEITRTTIVFPRRKRSTIPQLLPKSEIWGMDQVDLFSWGQPLQEGVIDFQEDNPRLWWGAKSADVGYPLFVAMIGWAHQGEVAVYTGIQNSVRESIAELTQNERRPRLNEEFVDSLERDLLKRLVRTYNDCVGVSVKLLEIPKDAIEAETVFTARLACKKSSLGHIKSMTPSGKLQFKDVRRILLLCTAEDEPYRVHLKRQVLTPNKPFKFGDYSVKKCDAVIVLLSAVSKRSFEMEDAIRSALAEKKPLLGVYIRDEDEGWEPSGWDDKSSCIK